VDERVQHCSDNAVRQPGQHSAHAIAHSVFAAAGGCDVRQDFLESLLEVPSLAREVAALRAVQPRLLVCAGIVFEPVQGPLGAVGIGEGTQAAVVREQKRERHQAVRRVVRHEQVELDVPVRVRRVVLYQVLLQQPLRFGLVAASAQKGRSH
jgi:hypothetical protein